MSERAHSGCCNSGADHNFLVEEIILAGDVPRDADFPQATLQNGGVERLNAARVGFEFESLIQSGGRWAIELNLPSYHFARMFGGQRNRDAFVGSVVSRGCAELFRAVKIIH